MQTPVDDALDAHDVVFHVGDVVQALTLITEADGDPDPDADPGDEGWIHAMPGALGAVEGVDPWGVPTVRYFASGTATITFARELRHVAAIGVGRRMHDEEAPVHLAIVRLEAREIPAYAVLAIHHPGTTEH